MHRKREGLGEVRYWNPTGTPICRARAMSGRLIAVPPARGWTRAVPFGPLPSAPNCRISN